MDLEHFCALSENTAPAVSPISMTVSQLNAYIATLFERDALCKNVYVKGEISNFIAHRSGHYYFSLKDEGGLIRAVMFKGNVYSLRFLPENGMKVIAHGYVKTYPRDGQYQLYVEDMQPDGVGDLYVAYEQCKAKLEKEGLFDAAKKKPIPKYPGRIGVITSPTGAAVRDILNILGRRFPFAEVLIYPALVQGDEAPAQLISGLSYFNDTDKADVIIIGRGGGSAEDLFAFQNEALARAVFASHIPVISAVGHETDFSICDFVADMRAPTPSTAAEIAVPDTGELLAKIAQYSSRAKTSLLANVSKKAKTLSLLENRRVLRSPTVLFERKTEDVLHFSKLLNAYGEKAVNTARGRLREVGGRLHALSPLAVLNRGYAAVFNEENKTVSSVADLKVNDRLRLQLSDGIAETSVLSVKQEKSKGKKE